MSTSVKPWAYVRIGACLGVAVATLVTACDGVEPEDRDRSRGPSVADSAGIEVVTNHGPAWNNDGWTIEREPALEIGVIEGDRAYEFEHIWDATRLPGGRIAISDSGNNEIRVFDAEGSHLMTLGGQGGGPGEFEDIPVIAVADPDTLVAWDGYHRRFSVFGPHGNLLDEVSLREALDDRGIVGALRVLRWDIRADRTLLTWETDREDAGGSLLETVVEPLLFVDNGETVRSLGRFRGHRLHPMVAGREFSHPWGPRVYASLGWHQFPIAVAHGNEARIELFDRDGEARRVVEVPMRNPPLSAEAVEKQVGEWIEQGYDPNDLDEALEALGVPDRLPAVGDLRWDSEGNLWIGRRSEDWRVVREYEVIDPEGHWLGSVEMPDIQWAEHIHEIGDEYILVTGTDEFDVQYLRKYRIGKD